jgi:preprotein translocase subunit SecF
MQIIKPDTNFDFVGKRRMAAIFSLLLILIGIGSLVAQGGPSYGIDFAGGTLVQVKFVEETKANDIKKALESLKLRGVTVQRFGDETNEFLLRAQNAGDVLEGSEKLESLGDQIGSALVESYGKEKVEIRRVEMVGPQVGKDLRMKGLLAILYAMGGILLYVTWRFEFRFAVGAILALVHDVLITLGVFSLFGKEIDLPIIAAFLAIIGYSLNDTIIIYDRIRENTGKHLKDGLAVVINRSINETLSRTFITSGTTLMVVLALFIFGGGVIHNFAFALLVGIVIGTYSSVFVASPLLIFWEDFRDRKKQHA